MILLPLILGSLVVSSPRKAALATVALVLLVVLVYARHSPALILFCGAVVVTSPFSDLLGRMQLGRFSANAALTGIYAAMGLVFLMFRDASRIRLRSGAIVGFTLLLTYALVSLSWGGVTTAGVQNLLVFGVFVSTLCAAASVVADRRETIFDISRFFDVVVVVALGLYAASLLAGGLGSGVVIGARSFGLLAILIVAWSASGWRYGQRWAGRLTGITILLVALSLSRTAFAASLLVFALSWLNARSFGGWLRLLCAVSAAGLVAYVSISHISALHSRFASGNVVHVLGGPGVNLEGRSELWSATWHSFKSSPYFGHGAGSTDSLITRLTSGDVGEVHNDYLRILNDYGVIGLLLWGLAYFLLLKGSWRRWQAPFGARGSPWAGESELEKLDRRLQAASFTALVGVALAMVTDNPFEYVFIMGPLGVLAGAAVGARLVQPVTGARPDEPISRHLGGLAA